MASLSLQELQSAALVEKTRAGRTTAERLERSPGLYLLIFTAVYCVGEVCSKLHQEFWFDELITYYLGGLPSIGRIWPLIVRGIELNPPLPFWITWVIHHTLGQGEVITRLPSIAGFWLMCVCLHYFVRRRADAVYGFVAMLLPLFTYTATEATWARGYGLMLGASGSALLSWQLAADGVRRRWALVGMAVSLAWAVSCHYYALYVAGALMLGEAIRNLERRRIDWAMWAGLVAGVSPLLAYASLIRTASLGSHAFWVRPMVRFLYESYADLLGPSTIVLLLGLAMIASARSQDAHLPRWKTAALPRHELAACLMLVAMPLVVYIASMFTPIAFFSRYVQPAVIGFSVIVTMFAYRIGGNSQYFGTLAASLLIGLCLIPWALFQTVKAFVWPRVGTSIQAWVEIPQDSNLKIVIDNENDFLTLFHYAPANLRERLYMLSDSAAAVRYLGSDTGLRSLQVLQSFHDVHLAEYVKFTSANREFLIERSHSESWITRKLLDDGANIRLIRLHKSVGAFNDDRLLFRVTMGK